MDSELWERETKYIPNANECLVVSDDEVKKAFARAAKAEVLYVDCETTGLNLIEDVAIGMSMCDAKLKEDGHLWAIYIPWGHKDYPGEQIQQANLDLIKREWAKLVNTLPPEAWRFYHARYDRNMLGKTLGAEIPFDPKAYDVMHAVQIIYPNELHGLKPMGEKLWHVDRSAWEGVLDEYRIDQDNTGDAKVPPAIEAPYAATDVIMTAAVDAYVGEQINRLGLQKILSLETNVLPIITRSSRKTIAVDQRVMAQIVAPKLEEIKALKDEFFSLSDFEGDTENKDDLRKWLYETQKYSVLEMEKNGRPSVAGWTIAKLAQIFKDDADMLGILAQLRELESNFAFNFKNLYAPEKGDIVDIPLDIAQITGAGFWATRTPNCSDWYAPDTERVKEALLVPEGKTWLTIDAPQFSITLMAQASPDEALRRVCRGSNIIKKIANSINVDEQVCADILKGKQKGMGRARIASVYHIDIAEIDTAWRKLCKMYPSIIKFYNTARDKAESGEPLLTPRGRRVTVPLDVSYRATGQWLIAKEADMWKWFGGKVDTWLTDNNAGTVLFPIEHGMVVEVDNDKVEEFVYEVTKINQSMVNRGNLPIPWKLKTSRHDLSRTKPVKLPKIITPKINTGAAFSIGA